MLAGLLSFMHMNVVFLKLQILCSWFSNIYFFSSILLFSMGLFLFPLLTFVRIMGMNKKTRFQIWKKMNYLDLVYFNFQFIQTKFSVYFDLKLEKYLKIMYSEISIYYLFYEVQYNVIFQKSSTCHLLFFND